MIAVCTFFRLKRFGETLKIACNSDAVPRAIALVAFGKLQWIRFHGVNRSTKEEEEAIERVSSSMKRDGIRVGSDSFVVNGGKNWWKGGGEKERERKKCGIRWRHQFIGTNPTANSINRKTFVCSRHPRIHKAQPRMSLYVGISTHACTQHAHCVYTRDNSKSRRQRRINSRQGWIYLSWHLQIPDPFVDTVNTSTTISSLHPV